ncbi:hypothetical protein [Streptomyces tsukubensis]|uniref:hypothetical protein n=1 Tax=Streptomyces tsukubensis TaxID=83656 RepID=UPI0011811F4C|nr:hypothetical protein [Streptomyces tsukubensis]
MGVVAVALIALPFLTRDKGSAGNQASDHLTGAVDSNNGQLHVPEGLESASAEAKKHGKKGKSPELTKSQGDRGASGYPSGMPSGSASPGAADQSAGATLPGRTPGAGKGTGTTSGHVDTKAGTSTEAPLVIQPVATLNPGTSWKAARVKLSMQTDGNLVLYDQKEKRAIWSPVVSGKGNFAVFQNDGNLVVYNAARYPIWASNADGFTDATLTIKPDGNLVVKSGQKQVWASNSHL